LEVVDDGSATSISKLLFSWLVVGVAGRFHLGRALLKRFQHARLMHT